VVTDQRIELRRPIHFAGRARLAPESNPVLDELARALRENPSLRIRVEGHTDSEGRARANLRLSRSRAAAVRRALIRRGIDRRRVVSQGYGEERPLAENSTPEGRSLNRRVEIVIIGR
jgi:OOP family OmpA-OmpF porin